MGNLQTIIIATRGSALALAQAHRVLDQCRKAFPGHAFDIKIIKTTGDKLLTASLAKTDPSLPKGLFTKELEVALVEGRADLAVHSLKDLPTELPPGLILGAVSERADVRDVLIYRYQSSAGSAGTPAGRGFAHNVSLADLPRGAVIATSSPRRQSQVLALRPDLKLVEIRGNVISRLKKLSQHPELDAILLAAAGIERLNFTISPEGNLTGQDVPNELCATFLSLEQMLPCVGQAALGIEVRVGDTRIAAICEGLNHPATHQCVLAERAFLRAMGGGCSAPIGAYAVVTGDQLRLRAVVFAKGQSFRGELTGPPNNAEALGVNLAARLNPNGSDGASETT